MEQSELDILVAAADKRAVYANQVEHAKAKFRSLNILYWEGHIFELHQNFVAFVYIKYQSAYSNAEAQTQGKCIDITLDPVIFLDKNDEPVLITDLKRFFEEVEECHTEALNYYHDTYADLRRSETTAELIAVSA